MQLHPYSVIEARNKLSTLLDQVERGGTVEIARRGKPVAVVVSIAEYHRRVARAGQFARAFRAWRATLEPGDLEGLARDHFTKRRDRSAGRAVTL